MALKQKTEGTSETKDAKSTPEILPVLWTLSSMTDEQRLKRATLQQESFNNCATVLVGDRPHRRACFGVYDHLVRTRAPKIALMYNSPSAYARGLNAIPADPDVFRLFLSWLNFGRLEYDYRVLLNSPAAEASLQGQIFRSPYLPLIRLVMLAEFLEVTRVANRAMDLMFEFFELTRTLPDREVIDWWHTHPPCPATWRVRNKISRIMVELWAQSTKQQASLQGANSEFMSNLIRRISAITDKIEKKGWKRISARHPPSRFHVPARLHEDQEAIEVV